MRATGLEPVRTRQGTRLRNVLLLASSSFQSCNVYQFRHARNAWCLRSGRDDLDIPAVCSSNNEISLASLSFSKIRLCEILLFLQEFRGCPDHKMIIPL